MIQPIKIFGGKHYLAHKIIKLMPPHLTYIEPYAGGLAVLLAKPYEGISEIANDIDGRLMNFWKVLQSEERFTEFKRVVDAVPFSEAEYNYSSDNYPEGQFVQNAVNFFVSARQSLAGRMKCFASISKNRVRRGMNEQVSAWLTAVEGLPEVHARLKRVLLLNQGGLEVIRKFADNAHTLQYLDPTYLHETRISKNIYQYEMDRQDHEDLLKEITADSVKCKIMLSGYDSELYDNYLGSWRKVVFPVSNSSSHSKKKPIKNEVVWCNFR